MTHNINTSKSNTLECVTFTKW